MQKDYTIVDAHCDTMSELLDSGEPFLKNDRHLNLEMTGQYKGYIQFFAAWIDENSPNWLSRTLAIIDKCYQELEKNRQNMQLVLSGNDIHTALKNGKTGMVLAIEDSRAICGSLANLRMLYRLGVRAMALAWNGNNDITDGIASGRGAGLTDFGREVVREMNQLGMIIDVSHITRQGFGDVLETTKSPVMASHSNAYTVCPHRRNLDDRQIEAMIKNEGFIGVNIYPEFLNNTESADITDIIRHIDHFLSLGGENTIGLGTDFDGVPVLPADIQNAGELYRLFDELLRLGYSQTLVDKISHQNMIAFLENLLKNENN